MPVNLSSPTNAGPHRRESFVKRYLDPTDRLGEILFGLIMVLTFTLGAGLIVQEGEDATREMLVGILGCNLAWGLIDGGMYVISSLYERSRKARLLDAVRSTASDESALAVIGKALDDRLEPLTSPDEREHLYRQVLTRLKHVEPHPTLLRKEDLYGALASFWLVFVSAIPAILPFLLWKDRFLALRISNGLLLVMLFLVGWQCARETHSNPWILGPTLVVVGLVLVGIAMAFGG
jgi:VIT1/CCC1 family predicted Fe2+/Mn2+ transporter